MVSEKLLTKIGVWKSPQCDMLEIFTRRKPNVTLPMHIKNRNKRSPKDLLESLIAASDRSLQVGHFLDAPITIMGNLRREIGRCVGFRHGRNQLAPNETVLWMRIVPRRPGDVKLEL
jgi:hypothetical protein